MRPRHPLPQLWLMTDERQGAQLLDTVMRLPRGAGVVFRHHRTPPPARRALYEQVRVIARARGLILVLAGPTGLAIAWRADGAHGRVPHRRSSRALLRTAPAHDARELKAAARAGADLIFLSPVFATRSHPGGRTLGPLRFGRLARQARVPVVALGGDDAVTRPVAGSGRGLWLGGNRCVGAAVRSGAHQNLKAVPI